MPRSIGASCGLRGFLRNDAALAELSIFSNLLLCDLCALCSLCVKSFLSFLMRERLSLLRTSIPKPETPGPFARPCRPLGGHPPFATHSDRIATAP